MILLRPPIKFRQPGHNLFVYNDKKELFEKNLKEMPHNWLWRTRQVNYDINKDGYREKEWNQIDWNNSILMFGCSLVFGVGIDRLDTCAHLLSQKLQAPVVNLGLPGASPMLTWANTVTLVNNKIKPRGVIYMWPTIERLSQFRESHIVLNHGRWTNDFCNDWIKNVEHCLIYTQYVIDSTSAMWQCPVDHFYGSHNVMDVLRNITHLRMPYSTQMDHARDISDGIHHPGPKTNQYWANKIYDKIKYHQ